MDFIRSVDSSAPDSSARDFGRRRFLNRFLLGSIGSTALLAYAPQMFAASDFWNTKDPSTWTEDEIRMLTMKSPWAKATVPTVKNIDDPTSRDAEPGGRGGRGGGGNFRTRSGVNVIVRWESAQPILDALHAPIPAEFEGHYVVSVTNLPGPVPRPGRGGEAAPDEALERLQVGASLAAKGKDPAGAGIARRTRIGSILFGFSKDSLRLTSSDREILFTLDTGPLTITAKFDGKDMTYHGKLAV
jgi:hypothetical protein